MGLYILDEDQPKLIDDRAAWTSFWQTHDHIMAHTQFHTPSRVLHLVTHFMCQDVERLGVPHFFATGILQGPFLEASFPICPPCLSQTLAEAMAVHAGADARIRVRSTGVGGGAEADP